MNLIRGVDVSHWEPALDWQAAKAAGIQFMSTKATEGVGSLDLTRKMHIAGAKAAGVLTGAYHFFHPNLDGSQQAAFFLKAVAGLPLDLPHALDFEAHDNVPSKVQIGEALKFLAVVEKASGKVPFVYLSPSFANEIGNPPELGRYPLWLANYAPQPHIPKPWTQFRFWQNSESGVVPGVQKGSHVDTDWFNGSIDDLRAVCGEKV